MEFLITQKDAGKCIKDILRELSLSVKMIKYLKYREDGILVNGERCTVRRVLEEGDMLFLATTDGEASSVIPVDLPLFILYEDEDIVLPNKPSDMPTHPSHDHHEDTVANALAYRYACMKIPFVFRPINRLDRNTSGVLLIARNKIAAGRLTRSMQQGEICKTYLAILDGELEGESGIINAPLHRTKESIILREVAPPDAPDADPCETHYRVLAKENGHTLVKAHPITGRTHQLRVHFAHLGHPITGDDLYGSPSCYIERHALHASLLEFVHPTTKERMTVQAPPPSDFEAALVSLFPDYINSRKDLI